MATYRVKLGSDKGLLVFEPKQLTVKRGDTIQWVCNKLPPHNIVFDRSKIPTCDKALAMSLSHKKLLFAPGETVTTRIPEDAPLGDYSFYCEPYRGAGMAGILTVIE